MLALLLLAQLLIASCYSISVCRQRGIDVFQHIHWFLVAYLAVYFVPLWNGRDWIIDRFDYSTVLLIYILPALALVFVIGGYRYGLQTFARTARNAASREVPGRAMAHYGFLLCIIGLIGEIWFVRLSGGVETYFSVGRTAGAYQDNTAYLYNLRWLWTPGLASHRCFDSLRSPSYFHAAGALWTLSLGYNVILGQRSGVWAYSLLGLALFTVWRQKRPSLAVVAGLICIILPLMSFIALLVATYLGFHFSECPSLSGQTGD